jgi:low affinity Fe/Cu permease
MTQLYEAQKIAREKQEKKPVSINDLFRIFSTRTAQAVGSKWAFIASLVVILVWAGTGPIFHFSDTWQLVINTGTTIVTFLMVFLIQATQNRDAKAIHLKLDELIRGVEGARTRLVDLENLSDEELDRLEREFKRIHEREKKKAEAGTNHPPPATSAGNGKPAAPALAASER